MRSTAIAAKSLGLVILSVLGVLALVVVPILVFAGAFAVGAALLGIASLVWLAIDGLRHGRAPAVKVARPSMAMRLPRRSLVMVQVTRVSGMCPLAHRWRPNEMFSVGPEQWPPEVACPTAQRMIQAEAGRMLAATDRRVHTLRCIGEHHLIEFELQSERALVRAA